MRRSGFLLYAMAFLGGVMALAITFGKQGSARDPVPRRAVAWEQNTAHLRVDAVLTAPPGHVPGIDLRQFVSDTTRRQFSMRSGPDNGAMPWFAERPRTSAYTVGSRAALGYGLPPLWRGHERSV